MSARANPDSVSGAKNSASEKWIADWLDAVASGASTMSQRKLTSIEKRGGIAAVRVAAQRRQIHLLRLEDDCGNELVAASRKPFEVIC